MAQLVDVHHHYFPPEIDKAKDSARVGWRAPQENFPWTPQISLKAMDSSGIQIALLSFPALPSGSISDENRALARARNDFAVNICQRYPHRFGFFATLPFLDDIEGVLNEISYALDVICADGVSISSSYGEGAASTYVGDDKYDPIWAELDRRKAVVFLHGNQIPSSNPWPHPTLGIPVTEVPNETFKAAAHLVVSGRKRRYPNVKIILSHLGGSMPFLAPRVAVLSPYMGCKLTPEQILDDFKTFYFDTALSAWGPSLDMMDSFVPHTQILYGTDFPAISAEIFDWYTRQLKDHYGTRGVQDAPDSKLQAIYRDNALRLFPRLRVYLITVMDGPMEDVDL